MPTKDKTKQAAYAARHYAANRERMIARSLRCNRERKRRNIEYVLNFLMLHPCVDCSVSDPVVLAFDHQSDKRQNVSEMVRNGVSIETLQAEINKCKVRCHNCHAIRTATQQGWCKRKCGGVEQSGSSSAS